MTSTNERPGQAGRPEAPPGGGDPLDMARNLARSVLRYAEVLDAAEVAAAGGDGMPRLQAHIAQVGERGHYAGQLAANLAFVSAAGDLRRIADVLCRADEALDRGAAAGETLADPLPFPMPGDPE